MIAHHTQGTAAYPAMTGHRFTMGTTYLRITTGPQKPPKFPTRATSLGANEGSQSDFKTRVRLYSRNEAGLHLPN